MKRFVRTLGLMAVVATLVLVSFAIVALAPYAAIPMAVVAFLVFVWLITDDSEGYWLRQYEAIDAAKASSATTPDNDFGDTEHQG